MATPTNLPASFTTGAVLTAAQMNDLRGAFRILQVVSGTTTTTTSTTSATYADTGLTATITPQSSSSTILVLLTQSVYVDVAATDAGFQLVKGSTSLVINAGVAYGTASANLVTWGLNYLDSPATTSATTYKTQMRRIGGTGTVYSQVNSNRSSIILMEVSA